MHLRLALSVFSCLVALVVTQAGLERDAHADFFSVYGQLQGGYIDGSGSDRFDEGGQGFFGFAAGASITVVDVFMDVRLDSFDFEKAGMWNQVGAGVSFGIPVPVFEPFFAARVAYLYAQYSEGAQDAYQDKLAAGDRDEPAPPMKGLNISVQAGGNLELIGPLYLTVIFDVGYHILLPNAQEDHGFNFSGIGALKLKFGI